MAFIVYCTKNTVWCSTKAADFITKNTFEHGAANTTFTRANCYGLMSQVTKNRNYHG